MRVVWGIYRAVRGYHHFSGGSAVTPPLEAVIVLPRRAVCPDRLPALAAAAAGRVDATQAAHLTRYPAFSRRLAEIDAQSVPAFARAIIRHTERTLIPSAVDRELRLSIFRGIDVPETAPEQVVAAAAAAREAFNELGSRLLGMAAWQDLDLSAAAPPIGYFSSIQDRHAELLDALGWVPPERLLPAARQAVAEQPDLLEFVLGPAVDGVVVWECEELIEMGLELLQTINETYPVVGIYIEDAAMRRPYAEAEPLRERLADAGVECTQYDDLELSASETADGCSPSASDGWQRASDLDRVGDAQ
jgi:hypothetical protein